MRVFLLHTVRPGLDSFEAAILELYPGHQVYNVLSDYWNKKVLVENEGFSKKSQLYLLETCVSMQDTGADMIVCTCNSLSPYLAKVRDLLEIPVVLIDEYVPSAILENGHRILVVATADSSVNAAISSISLEAERQEISCELTSICLDDAGQIMRSGGDMAEHDRIIIESLSGIQADLYDAVLLTQLSTAHLGKELGAVTGLPVVTTPEICLRHLKPYLS